MKLLWVAPIKFGSTIHQSGEIGTAQALRRSGWDVDFLSIKPTKEGEAFIQKLNFSNHTVKKSKIPGLGGISFNFSVARWIKKKLKNEKYDIILTEWHSALGVHYGLKSHTNTPKVVFEDRSPPADPSLLGRLQWVHYDLSWRFSSRKSDLIEVLVPGLENFVRGRHKDLPSMIHCPSGVDLSRFRPSKKASGPTRIVYHGSLDDGRGLHRLEKFSDELARHNFNHRIIIIGKGPLGGDFNRLSLENNNFEYLGEVRFDELPGLISRCHFGILPLPDLLPWRVGSPLKLMECASAGLPVLATDVEGCMPYSGQSWLCLADRKDPVTNWTRYVKEHSIHDKEYGKISRLARKYAEENFSWDSAVKDLDKGMKKLLQK